MNGSLSPICALASTSAGHGGASGELKNQTRAPVDRLQLASLLLCIALFACTRRALQPAH